MVALTSAYSFAANALDPVEAPLTHIEWCKQELPQTFTLPWGPHHRWMFGRLGKKPKGVRAFCGAARGSGKTTTALFGVPLAAVALGSHRFIVIIRASQDEANAALEMLRSELESEHGQELQLRWPGLRFAKRAFSNQDRKNQVKEVALIGGRIVALGAGAKIRGLIRRAEDGEKVRPDLVVFDDLEDPEQARSKLRTDRLEEWVMADVSQLGGTKQADARRLDVIGIGTTIATGAMATRILRKKGRFQAWQTKSFPAESTVGTKRVANWPEGQPLVALDRLLDPNNEEFIGSFTYATEYLLDPKQRSDTLVKSEWLHHGRAPRNPDGSYALAFQSLGIDPAATEEANRDADYSAIVRVGIDPSGRVWVVRVHRGWWSPTKLFDEAQRLACNDSGQQEATISFEGVGGFRWGIFELRRRMLAYRAVQPRVDKVSRFMPISVMYEAGRIWHDESLADSDFEVEVCDFPGGEHDDFVDALWLAVMLATNEGRRQMKGESNGSGGDMGRTDVVATNGKRESTNGSREVLQTVRERADVGQGMGQVHEKSTRR